MPEIDMVVVATPSGMHFEHSMEFLEIYGKHVIIEKPTFMRPEQLNKAYDVANKYSLHIFPVFLWYILPIMATPTPSQNFAHLPF